jgi:hypothetical protein
VFYPHLCARLTLYAALVAGVLLAGRWAVRRHADATANAASAA